MTRRILTICLVLAAGCGSSLPKPGLVSPPGASFAGVWDTNWGRLTLRQAGEQVHGQFQGFRNGSISGTAQGDLLMFRWRQEESQQWGRGYLRLLPGAQAVDGRWGYLKDYAQGGRWWGKRVTPSG